MDMSGFHTVVLLLVINFIFVQSELHCFKKLHSTDDAKRGPICRGIIYKSSTSSGTNKSYRSPKGCCRNGGVGYKEGELTRVGRRALKYPCTLCPGQEQTTAVSSTANAFTVSRQGWSDWEEWSQCSATCAVGFKSRQRVCYSACVGDSSERKPCVLISDCPVDGAWGPWHEWNDCSATCGGGSRVRTRQCNDPIPRYGGKDCPGNEEEAVECSSNSCPVNGGWSEWSVYPCSATCGSGQIIQNRTCNNPVPQHHGLQCEGPQSKNDPCPRLPKCPIDGQWSLWYEWGPCSATCGTGVRERQRFCAAPKPRHGGANCTGNDIGQGACYHPTPCEIDGGWTEWNMWGSCLAEPCTGAKGYATRKRTCKNPIPQYGGALCVGENNETRECTNNEGCPVDGGWCDWSKYSQCLISDVSSFKIKTKECGCPPPSNGGMPCLGIDYETKDCLTDDETRIRCLNRQFSDVEQDTESSGYIPDEEC